MWRWPPCGAHVVIPLTEWMVSSGPSLTMSIHPTWICKYVVFNFIVRTDELEWLHVLQKASRVRNTWISMTEGHSPLHTLWQHRLAALLVCKECSMAPIFGLFDIYCFILWPCWIDYSTHSPGQPFPPHVHVHVAQGKAEWSQDHNHCPSSAPASLVPKVMRPVQNGDHCWH